MGSLRRQSLLMITLVLVACMALVTIITRFAIEHSMREFESRDATQTLERIKILLNLQMINMRKQSADYAVWNTTYDYMHNNNPSYIQENYSEEIFNNLDIDYVYLIDPKHRFVMALIRANQIIPGSTGIRYIANVKASALSNRILNELDKSTSPKLGTIIRVNGKLYLYGSSTILTNSGIGKSRGNVVFIRTLDQKRMNYLKMQAQENFNLIDTQAKQYIAIDDERIISTMALKNTQSEPVAAISVNHSRPLKQLVFTTRKLISLTAIVLTLLALIVVFLMLDRLVLRKIDSLVHSIFNIRQTGIIGNRLVIVGDQDIDRISTEVNNLLDNLAGSHSQLQYDALHDHLTGLGNRKLFLQQLERACSDCRSGLQKSFYVYLLDLDAFKDINDLHGHLAGDHVIKTIAGRLQHSAKDIDLPIRIGGDEFALIVRPQQALDPEHFAAHLLELITLPIIWESYSLTVYASIGIVAVDNADKASDKPIELLRKADIAMYASKNSAKNGYRLFHEDIDKQLSERKRLESELDEMIAQESSEIWLQPIINQSDGTLFAVEVLSRWFHPEMGEIYPDVFIGIAEESMRIVKFDQSVIRRSCQLFSELQLLQPQIRMSVNISATTLMEPCISKFIADILQSYALPEDVLMLEITETALATRENTLIDSIQAIRKLGVRFLIDDFGTGYSSLSRLHTLPLDFVKIDRRFLQTLESDENPICNAIIRLAHSLDMQVIAEGVETQLQHQRLAALDCDFAQGYYYAKPMPYKDLHSYMNTINRS